MNVRMLRNVALFVALFALIFFFAGLVRDWLVAQFGEATMRAATGYVALAALVVVVIALIPALVRGMTEILAEPATGPARLPSFRRRSRSP